MNGTRKTLAGLCAAAAITFSPGGASAAQKELVVTFNGGAKFPARISWNHSPGSREITVDCSRMGAVLLQNGEKRLAPTVAFIDLFNLLNTEGMGNYSSDQRRAIEQASNNRSLDKNSVTFMVAHVVGAHGVAYEEIRSAGKECEKRAVIQ